jgi:tetratricopeptide (TPR) repeat protein
MCLCLRFSLLSLFAATLLASPACADDPHSYDEQAQQLISQGEYDKALDQLTSAVSLFPYDQGLKRSLLAAYLQVAQREMKQGRYAKAADYFGRAHELSPGSTQLGLMRGVALYYGKDYDGARSELRQAGDGAQPLFYLGKISYDTGDLPGALNLWRQALEKEPGNKEIRGIIEKAERELPVESRMDRGYSSMFDLSFDAELPPGLSSEVLDALESAYNSVGADLGIFPTTRIPVLLYTKSDYSLVTAGPDWSGGLYDGKIRLPVGGISKVSKQLRAVIFHEYTHVLIAELTHGNIPTWLNEGLAEVEGQKEFKRQETELVKAAAKEELLSFKSLSGSFGKMDGTEASLAYQQSHSIAEFMVSRYGWYAIQQILKHLGERESIESSVSLGLADFALDLPGVIAEWRQSLPVANKQ